MDELQELLDARNTALAEMRKIVDRNADKAEWSGEDEQEYARLNEEAANNKSEYESKLKKKNRLDDLNAAEDEMRELAGRRQTNPNNHSRGTGDRREATRNVIWTPEQSRNSRQMVLSGPRNETSYQQNFTRYLAGQRLSEEVMNALSSDNEESAGYLVADTRFVEELLKNVDDAVFIQGLARVLPLSTARTTGIRKRVSKTNTFTKGSELKDITTDDQVGLTYGKRVLTPHYHSGWIRISRDLIRSAIMPIEGMVREEIVTMLAEYLEDLYLTGTGMQEPLGVFTASSEGISTSRDITVLAGEATTITSQFGPDTLKRAKYNMKKQYRDRARWMFHRDAMSFISRLKDGESRYLWQPAITAGEPDRLLNLPYDESEWAPNTFSTGNYFGILAVWDYYYITYALDMEFQRLNELAARTNEYEYHVRIKMDAMPVLEEAFTRLKFG